MLRLALSLLLLSTVPAWGLRIWPVDGPHWVYVGPEIYHVSRDKPGRSTQSGTLVGVRAGYDRIRSNSFYWGVDGHWAKGEISGASARGSTLVSEMTDGNVEGRGGYTLGYRCATLSPFIGGGYFKETNNFIAPSPLPLHFRTTFRYVTVGCLSRYWWREGIGAGVDFKVKFVADACQKVTNDPMRPDATLLFNSKLQYTLDFPLTYSTIKCGHRIGLVAVPLIRYRRYGGREGFPFNFFDTRIHIYGVRLLFSIWL